MTVDMTIRVQIDLDDEDVGDPAPGDPLEHRMLATAQEAVSNAIMFIEQNAGYEHDLVTLASVGFVGVEDCHRVNESAEGDDDRDARRGLHGPEYPGEEF